jgi:cytochrome c oxidase subunit II
MRETMKKKIGFGAAIEFFALALLSTRIYMVDLPVWHILGGGEGPDPATLHLHGEFVESNLGIAEDSKGTFTVRMIAQQYVFVPQCIVAPAGVPVRFRITSADAVHKLSFLGTEYGLKAVPGAVTEATFIFAKAGEFKIPCHEFCGPGHYAMRGRLEVVPENQFPQLNPEERRSCEPR